MSFSRARRSIVADRNPKPNFHHHHHHHHHHNNNPSSFSQSVATTSYHRDRRPFADSAAGVGPPPTKKRKAREQRDPEEEASRSRYGSSKNPSSAEAGEPLMSRDEIDRRSPSGRDGIDRLLETHLRYTYCAYLQSIGTRLELPQTTIGTAIVLCHRFFLRRSHASHDRFLIATAALFLAAKSEETPCLLNTVLRVSCEICQKQNFDFFPYMFYSQDWFEQYRERVTEAEQMILTTLDFELEVQHPYVPLTSVLNKLGLSQTVLFNLAWNLISEGLRSSLWLQFKPHHIAAGAAFVAARFLNFDLSHYQSIWHEFQTTPYILQDIVQQLMELF
ncbi:uncharacterized protein M6B38_227855 [Iris pallida]|uniref:Cyclin-like domain-containing protein n=1 Tax=Iris pallida TaxID=29817 RepID=A0AAX6DSZ6_IRIPA|nr:uncharacterized protein M6B38_227855 [Iris pallida]